MITVPRDVLLKQTAATLREYGIPFSYIAGGYDTNPMASVFIATTQALDQRIKNGYAPDIDLLMPDETHWGGAQLNNIITHYRARGARGIGMSATPLLMSGHGMRHWYDDMVKGKSIKWLIENGRLSNYRMFQTDPDDLRKATKGRRKLVGDEVEHYRKNAMGKLAIAYCESVAHSKDMAARFNAAGIPAANIDGYMKDDARQKIIMAYARREILVLCNNMLLTFGFDLKAASGIDVTIEAMIDSAYTESLPLQMQKWGRVLRKKGYPALIFDHAGNRYTHGYPDDDRNWTLSGESKDFGSGYGSVPVKNCCGGTSERDGAGEKMPPCYFSHRPAPRCPNCGCWYDLDIKITQSISGELSEQNKEPRRALTREEAEYIREVRDALIRNAINKGMPPAAAVKWATNKATQQTYDKIDAERAHGDVSLQVGAMEIML